MIAALALLLLTCGTERWDIKTLQDPRAGLLANMGTTTVEHLSSLVVPLYDDTAPRRGFELSYATVEAELVGFKLEDDGDIHAVIRGDTGATMVIEFPSSECMAKASSEHQQAMRGGRLKFSKLFGRAHRAFRRIVPKRIKVTGVVFLDRIHGQTGVAQNGCELHPVTALEVL